MVPTKGSWRVAAVLLLSASSSVAKLLPADFRHSGLSFHESPSDLLDTRQSVGNCAEQYGPGNIQCPPDGCYNPDIGEDCCSNGNYCRPGRVCAAEVGFCCRVGDPDCETADGGGGGSGGGDSSTSTSSSTSSITSASSTSPTSSSSTSSDEPTNTGGGVIPANPTNGSDNDDDDGDGDGLNDNWPPPSRTTLPLPDVPTPEGPPGEGGADSLQGSRGSLYAVPLAVGGGLLAML